MTQGKGTGTSKSKSRVYHVTKYGADPTGKNDSTEALLKAISDAMKDPGGRFLISRIADVGGARIDLDGGDYLISSPLRFPMAGVGNVVIHGGTLRASANFPADGYLIELSSAKINKSETHKSIRDRLEKQPYSYEYITLRDLMVDSNFRGGGISVTNSLRTSIDNCYISHYTTEGILVQGGHETYIRNSYLGQHINAGGDPGEHNFSGTAISLIGNDNAVTDVVIFSASIGIFISGQANVITGVHCYNKATMLGGTGIYLEFTGLTQTRIVNSYFDFTGIVAEDPVQVHITNNFFLGDAFILLKSINGVIKGVNIVDNMFSGSGQGIEIVQLEGEFKKIDQVVVDRNNVNDMKIRSTVARGVVQGKGSSWTVDFNSTLLFPNLTKNVQYTLSTSDGLFPMHALRSTSDNKVVIESSMATQVSISVVVDQGR
ncbi:Pectate lyase superfamily protein [Dillenia turbinata]|uniref:Pectate lyase superfamily protein n=1 Tax=Dillenia turbinata TaxID=194707 RepID=A0AAN8VHN8_9MAGN